MDAITLLMEQHAEAKQLFTRFRDTEDTEELGAIADEAIEALRAHTTIEEEVFYPAIRQAEPSLDEDVLEGLEEHHVVEVLLDELEGIAPDDEHFRAKFIVATELVEHHIDEEESEVLPAAREAMDSDELEELGERMQARYQELAETGDVDGMSKDELYEQAKQLDVAGRSQMSKRQLADAVRAAS